MGIKLAIYDVDYTIIPFSCFTEIIIYTLIKYPFKFRYLPQIIVFVILERFRLISLETSKQSWLLIFKDFTLDQLSELARQFSHESIIPNLKKGVLENIIKNKEMGYKIVLASASCEFCLSHLAEYIQADYLFGTRAIKRDNYILPKISGKYCMGDEKVKRIRELIPVHNLKESISYSDSESDLPFLKISRMINFVDKKTWKIVEQKS